MLCGRTIAVVVLGTIVASVAHWALADEPSVAPRKILFDTDPGGDDIFALLWLQSLAKQGKAEIVAVTTTDGNVSSRQTFLNASRTLTLGGFADVEVGRSSVSEELAVDAAHIHGADGMGNLSQSLPAATHRWQTARRSDDILIEKLNAHPGAITLVAVGPLTNLAAAERKSPGILAKAKEVVVMGGAFVHRGNITAQAEFNIYCDPESAALVFASRDDIVVLPLDVTTRVNFQAAHAESVRRAAPNSPVAGFLADLSEFLIKSTLGFRETQGVSCFHVHDATTLAYVFYPQTLLFRRALVRVETRGQWTRGQTVFDQRHGARPKVNAWVAQQVDAANLLAILVEDFKQLCTK